MAVKKLNIGLSGLVFALGCQASMDEGSLGMGGSAASAGGGSARGGAGTSGGGAGNGAGAANAGAAGCVKTDGCMLAAPASTGDVHQDCVDRINQFRTQCACLPPLARWTDGEACADQMAEYDSQKDSPHAGFSAKICSGGQAQNECPSWASNTQVITGCLQQMWSEGPPPTATCTGSCFNDYGHYINMASTTSTKVACGFHTTASGKVWAAQNFSR